MCYNIKFSPPDITEEEIKEVSDTLRSGWITTGPKTARLEDEIANFCNTSKAICLNSATACMELTLRLLGIGEGDEVITTAYTYTATCSVICHVGAKPILVDTALNSFEMDYEALSKAITEKTKAIIPVDLGGVICNYERIFNIVKEKSYLFCAKNNIQECMGRIAVIADSAHAFGALYRGKKAGEIADFTSFSFHAVKNFTTAEGGAITWRTIRGIDNADIYSNLRLLSLHGQNKSAFEKAQKGSWEYDIISPAYKCNMTDIMASIGLVQLRRYPGLLSRRKEIIEIYNEGLKDENIEVLDHYSDSKSSSGHLYMVRLNGKDVLERNRLICELGEKGIATNVHFKPLPMLTAYKNLGFNIKNFPNAYNMYKNEISLPLHTLLTNKEVEYIINMFKECLYKL